MNMLKPEKVKDYFDQNAARFDAIYKDDKNFLQSLRDKFSREVIKKRFDLTFKISTPLEGKSVIDIGCGSGRYSIEFARQGASEVLGLDFSKSMIDMADAVSKKHGYNKICRFTCEDFLKINPGKKYDISTAMGFFDYLQDPGVFIEKMSVVTAGVMIASFPKKWHWLSFPRKARLSFLKNCPVYFYTRRGIKNMLAKAGISDFDIHSLDRDYILVARPCSQKRTRVLHIITRLILGGAQENTLLTAEGFVKKKEYSVMLACGQQTGPEGDLFVRAKQNNVEIIIVPQLVREIRPFNDIIALIKLYFLIRKNRFDIVHTHSSKAGIIGRVAAHWAGTPIVVHTLHSLVYHEYQNKLINIFYIFLKKIVAKYTDKFISVADFISKKAVESGIAEFGKFVTIRSGMELEKFSDAATSGLGLRVREKLNIAPDVLVIGKVGRLFHLKGHEYVIEAAPAVIRVFPYVKFLFVGNGILQEELKGRAKALGVLDSFIFAGLVDREDVAGYITAMDIVVHTSLREGLARVIPQAMAMAKPVISFDLDGSGEVVINGKTGILVPPKDPGALADAMIKLLTDAAMRSAMGKSARELLSSEFRVEDMVEKINNLYKQLLGEKI